MKKPFAIILIAGIAAVVLIGVFKRPAIRNPSPEPAAPPLTGLSHLPTPKKSFIAPTPEPELPSTTTNATNAVPPADDRKITLEQAEAYLRTNGRRAETLYAAFQASGERKFLNEAMREFPKDPKIAFTAALMSSPTPEERRQWLEVFKQADPGNALGNYLSAQDYFKSGQPDKAIQEIQSAAGKTHWTDYAFDSAQNAEEAYLSAGYSPVESKAAGFSSTLLPDLAQLKQLGLSLAELAQSYQQSGDQASAQAALQTALNLGRQVSNPEQEPIITTLVGFAIENKALAAMDPSAIYDVSGQTVADRIAAITEQRADIKALNQQLQGVLPTLTDQGLIGFYDRQKALGPQPAMRWALQKYGQQ